MRQVPARGFTDLPAWFYISSQAMHIFATPANTTHVLSARSCAQQPSLGLQLKSSIPKQRNDQGQTQRQVTILRGPATSLSPGREDVSKSDEIQCGSAVKERIHPPSAFSPTDTRTRTHPAHLLRSAARRWSLHLSDSETIPRISEKPTAAEEIFDTANLTPMQPV